MDVAEGGQLLTDTVDEVNVLTFLSDSIMVAVLCALVVVREGRVLCAEGVFSTTSSGTGAANRLNSPERAAAGSTLANPYTRTASPAPSQFFTRLRRARCCHIHTHGAIQAVEQLVDDLARPPCCKISSTQEWV